MRGNGIRVLIIVKAAEWRQHKITVNTYAPGSILTPMGSYYLSACSSAPRLIGSPVLHPDDAKNGGPASTAKKVRHLDPKNVHLTHASHRSLDSHWTHQTPNQLSLQTLSHISYVLSHTI